MLRLAVVGVSVLAFVLWCLWALQNVIFKWLGLEWNASEIGQWGDTFGALNALFAAGGFMAVLATLWIQRREIQRQQQQLDEAQRDQQRERFESSFFQLLGLLRELRSEVTYVSPSEPSQVLNGSQALKAAYRDVTRILLAKKPLDRPLSRIEIANIYGVNIYKPSEDGLGPYFRVIYTILKRVYTDTVLTEQEKIRYGNLLRGQLGSPEVALTALNGLIKQSKDLARYLNYFRIPRYLPDGVVKKTIAPFYDPNVFESRKD